MLTMTDSAAAEIRDLIARPEVPEGGGLRIADDPAAGGLTLSLAAGPSDGEAVVDASGARLFLDPRAAELLDGKELDTAVDADGQLQFAVADQGV
jgi:iron-sulfur cluster assembly protein